MPRKKEKNPEGDEMMNDLVRIVRYNVLDAAGKMSFSQTEAQKDAIVGAGGTVINVIRLPGYEKPSLITPTPPDIPLVMPPPEIVEEDEEEPPEAPPVRERVAVEEMLEPIVPPPEEPVGVGVRPDQVPIVLGPPVEEEIVEEVVEEPPVKVIEEPPPDVVERVAVEEKLVPVTVVPIPVVPITPELITTTVWTVKIVDPGTGEIIKTEKFDNEKDAKVWAAYQQMAITRLPTIEEEREVLRAEIGEPWVKTEVSVDPNLVTYMGITMTREQFEADFPPDTIPDPVLESTGLPPVDIGKAYEDVMTIIPDSLRNSAEILSERSLEAAAAGKPFEGFLNYLGSVAYRGSTAVYDTGTFLIRPELWRQTAQTIGYLLAADKPETRAEHNQRIADFVKQDIADPTMQEDVTKFLQETVPFTPQSQEYLDEAKEFRQAFAAQVAADPFRFAVEIGASIYTGRVVGKFLGNLKENLKVQGRKSGFGDDFVQQQIDKLRPLSEIEDLIADPHVAAKFRDLPDPQMFRGTDLQPPPGVEAWSADLYTTGSRRWTPAYEGKGAWQPGDPNLLSNAAALEIARDVAAKGGQTLVYLRDPLTNQVAGVMTQADFFSMTAMNPIAFAGLGVTITVVDAGGAQSVIDEAVKDGIFDEGFTPTPITLNQILVTIDKTTLQQTVAVLNKTELMDIDENTMLDVLPKLELDTLLVVVPDLDRETKLVVIPKLDRDVITDVLPKLDRDTILDVVPKLDKDVIVDVLPKLDTDITIDVIQDLDDDTLVAVIPKLDPVIIPDIITIIDTDIVVDVITELDDDTIIVIIPKLDDITIQELVPHLEEKLDPGRLDHIERRLPTRVRRKFKRARKKRPPIKLPPSKEPEPYRVSFQYTTGASETERVEAKTYHEALVVAQEQKQITLNPVEVEVEKLSQSR